MERRKTKRVLIEETEGKREEERRIGLFPHDTGVEERNTSIHEIRGARLSPSTTELVQSHGEPDRMITRHSSDEEKSGT